MAVLFFDTASFYANSTQASQGFYNSAGMNVATSGLPAGAISPTAWSGNANSNDIALPSPGAGPFIFGFRWYQSSFSGQTICEFLDNSKAVQVLFAVNASGTISAYRASTSNLLGTTSSAISVNTWNYLEFKVKCDPTTGTVDVHFNNGNVLSLTGQNTQGQSTATLGFIRMAGVAAVTTYYQDLYVCDTTGGAPANTFLGDCRVWTSNPTANGNYTAWT